MNHFDQNYFQNEIKISKHDEMLHELFGNEVDLTYHGYTLNPTPRQYLLAANKFSMVSLYYLKFLVDANPKLIIDIGCGGNLFKPVLNKLYGISVHGIDPINEHADEQGYFDINFSKAHTDQYASVFSICALHFCTLKDLTNVVSYFYNTIAVGGRGYLSLNAARMLDKSDSNWLCNEFGSKMPKATQLENWINEQLLSLKIKYTLIDLFVDQQLDEYVDGNIRILFEKGKGQT